MQVRAVLAVLVAIAAAPAALADTLKVPSEEYATIQSAVDASDDGDVIVVAAGEYPETVTIAGKSDLEIRGKGWPVIQGPDAGFVVEAGSYGILLRGFDLDQAAVEASDSSNVTLTKLRIHDVDTAIVSNGMNGFVVSKCEIRDIGSDAVFDYVSVGYVFEKCLFENITGFALLLSPTGGIGTDNAVLSKNRVYFAEVGFVLGGADALVEKNRMEGLTSAGIAVSGSTDCARARVVKNRVQTSGTTAISVGIHDDVHIEKNVLTGGGISALGEGHLVTGNRIFDATQNGISLTGKATVDRNKILSPSGYGVIAQADDTTVFGNTVVDAGQNGFEIAANDCTVEKNRSLSAGSMGFFVDGTGNVLTANKASGSVDFDLADMAAEGVNTYEANRFGTTQFNYVP